MTKETLHTEAGERLFRTDGGGDRETGEPLFTLPHGQVRDLPATIDYVKLTSEGRLQIALLGEAIRGEDLAKVRDLLTVMSGRVRVDFTPEQGELRL
jgi:hypothetical protein